MSLEQISKELKEVVSTYNTQWFLGDLANLMKCIANGAAEDQLGRLSSPMRQLYFLGGLLMTSNEEKGTDIQHDPKKWNSIVDLLNEIEGEYDNMFFSQPDEEIDEEWKKIREVAMPSFLSYFNQGPLNYEEQTINWVRDLYTGLDDIILAETGLSTENFIDFYNALDSYVNANFQAFSTHRELLKPDWEKYTKLELGPREGMPEMMIDMFEERKPMMTFVADHGIIQRFFPSDLVTDKLSEDQKNIILSLLSCKREESDFLYYTSTRPGNPIYEKPIADIGEGMFQVFEVKQVIHAIDALLEGIIAANPDNNFRLTRKKGKLLEENIIALFSKFFKKDYKVFSGYYVDGCEQDILFLWRNYAFIIEAKGYKIREPFRDPEKAFVRIKDDFNDSVGYGFLQTQRVEKKFVDQIPLRLEDKDGNLIEEIDTKAYDDKDFSIIVNLKSFGQIQNDLENLLEVFEENKYPWVVKYDDLEVFLLTLIAKKKNPEFFISFLEMREQLHGKLICSDELEVCGGYLNGKITQPLIDKPDTILTTPDLTAIFDEQYNKGMGFENEKLIDEKRGGRILFW